MRALTPIVIVIQAAATIISMAVAAPVDPNGAQSALEKSRVVHMLIPCPDKPNCVSSLASAASDPRHALAPMRFGGNPSEAWDKLRQTLSAMPRTRVVEDTGDYLHAEATSLVFRFVDDLECLIDHANGVIHVRSASRAGYSDFGVNRRRVEQLRALMGG